MLKYLKSINEELRLSDTDEKTIKIIKYYEH